MDLKDLNDYQRSILNEFRELMSGYQLPSSSDTFLLRWLIARNFDLAKAQTMLINSLEWRRKNRIDCIHDFKNEVMEKYGAMNMIGKDKLGQPVYFSRYGRADVKGQLLSTTKEEYLKQNYKLAESSNWLCKTGRFQESILQITVIFDMQGFTLAQATHRPTIDIGNEVTRNLEANYPEVLGRVIVINAPTIVSIAYAFVRPFLDERTNNKVQIYGHDSEQWKKVLLTYIDADQLPACYGGTMTDPDGNPNCQTLFNIDGKVPKSYYLCNQIAKTSQTADGDFFHLNLPPGNKEIVEFQIDSSDSVLRWDFYTKEGDVAFAVYYKNGEEMIPVVPHGRVNSHISTEKGQVHCQQSGSYVAEFDNTFSYLRSKELWYSIVVEKAI